MGYGALTARFIVNDAVDNSFTFLGLRADGDEFAGRNRGNNEIFCNLARTLEMSPREKAALLIPREQDCYIVKRHWEYRRSQSSIRNGRQWKRDRNGISKSNVF